MLNLLRPGRIAGHALAMLLTITSLAKSQEPETIPADLAAALIGAPADAIVIGRVPDGLDFEVPMPAGGRVLGGVRQFGATTVVIEVPLGRREAMAAAREALMQAGWTEPTFEPFRGRPEGGFQTSGGPMPGALCNEGAMASTSSTRNVTPDRTVIRLSFAQERMGSICSPQARAMNVQNIPLPRLVAPDMGEMRGAGGGSSNGRADSEARIETTMSVAALSAHFHAQMIDQDWTQVADETGETASLRTYTMEDDNGRWYAALIIIRRGTEPLMDLMVRVIAEDAR